MQRRAFSLQARPPFRLDLTVWALRRRPDNAVDAWDGCTYRRSLRVESGVIELAAVQAGTAAAPRLEVTVAGTQVDRQAEKFARAMVARLLGRASRSTSPPSTSSPKAIRFCTRWPRGFAD
jgi:DNA-3-methyladenine glycosylase II